MSGKNYIELLKQCGQTEFLLKTGKTDMLWDFLLLLFHCGCVILFPENKISVKMENGNYETLYDRSKRPLLLCF